MIFWALEQRKKWAQEREQREREWQQQQQEQARQRQENAAQERARIRTQAQFDTLAELLSAGILEPTPELERWARAQGINWSNLPPRLKRPRPAAPDPTPDPNPLAIRGLS